MRCPACHEEYDDNMEYCPHCGNDNPNVEQREIREELEKPKQTPSFSQVTPNYSTSSEESSGIVTMSFNTDDGNYQAHFDLSDEKEKAAYDELMDLDGKKTGHSFLSIF